MTNDDIEPLLEKLRKLVMERNDEAERLRKRLFAIEAKLNSIGPLVSAVAYEKPNDRMQGGLSYGCRDKKWRLSLFGKPIQDAPPTTLLRAQSLLPKLIEALCERVCDQSLKLRAILKES